MTNFEWLLKEKIDFVKDNLSFAWVGMNDNGALDRCSKLECDDCVFGKDKETPCKTLRRNWLEEEHNPYTIPLDTPIDTKVLVSNNGLEWLKRYFAGFSKNESQPYRAFSDGVSNWSKGENFGICEWKYCKLAEGSEE